MNEMINAFTKDENKNENTISSREVAEMMEVQHKHMLEKIDKLNEILKSRNLGCSKYWTEGTYKQQGNGKECREYQVTKRGCELIAHKTEGEKGVMFTVKYMERFEEMENQLQNQLPKTYIEALEQLLESEKEKARVALELKEEQHKNELLMHVNKLYTTTEIAKELGMKSAAKLNAILKDKKVQYKQNGTWVLYSDYASLGYVSIKQNVLENGHIIYDRKWTQDGRKFVIDLLS